MFGVIEIINNFILGKPLTREQKFKILNSKKINPKIFAYLSCLFENLTIEILGNYEGNILDLMKNNLLLGWCWQTTETSVVFLNDDDYIERGNLYFEDNKPYYHSWICFKFEGIEYVFDPCLNLLCKKSLYTKIFETEVKGRTTAKEVREELIDNILNPKVKEKDELSLRVQKMLEKVLGNDLEKQREYTHIKGNNDVNSPMYRNNTGYKIVVSNGKIKKLVAHYYLSGY